MMPFHLIQTLHATLFDLRSSASANGQMSMSSHREGSTLELSIVDLQEFNSEDTLRSFVTEYAEKHGFRAVITHSNDKAMHFACQHHPSRRRRSSSPQRRSMASTDCPFALVAHHSKRSRTWTLKVKHSLHNHVCDTVQTDRENRVNADIVELHRAGNKPAFIQRKLISNYPDMEQVFTRNYIYEKLRNYKKRERRSQKALRGEMRADGNA